MAGSSDDVLSSVPGSGADSAASGVRSPRPSPLLGGDVLKGVPSDLRRSPFVPAAPSDKTPANVGDTKNFTPPPSAPSTFDPTNLPGTPSDQLRGAGAPQAAGPITPDLVLQAGFPKEEAADWTSLANWITHGESALTGTGAFTELYNGKQWTGANTNHPYLLGWPGDVGPDGRPTSAYGVFQDEKDTWAGIAKDYLKGDTTMTPVNQVKGNLLMAADIYQRQTGRNLLADWKAGNVASVTNALASTWPSLRNGVSNGASGDYAFSQYIGQTRADIATETQSMQDLFTLARQSDPMSDEMKVYLHKAMERADKLSEKYEALSEKPPQSQTPMQAGASFMPMMSFLALLGGFATRRPALGAINAMSGALAGLKEGNDQQYSNNVDLWKTHMKAAQEAFEMQNVSVRNIMEDITLTDREKQSKLQDAFRFWEMKHDLDLARENNWKEIYERQDQREAKEQERQLLFFRTQKAFTDYQEAYQDKKDGSADLTGNIRSIYKDLYGKFQAANGGRDATPEEQLQMKQQAIQMSHTANISLTPPQEAKNKEIDDAKKYFGAMPTSFDDDVAAVQGDQSKLMDNDALAAKKYTPRQIALYRALTRPSTDPNKSAADADLIKRFTLSKQSPFTPRQVLMTDYGAAVPTGGAATPTGPAGTRITEQALNAKILEVKGQGANRDEAKAIYLEAGAPLGLGESDFDRLWPAETATPTGPVGQSPITNLGIEPGAFRNSPIGTGDYLGLGRGGM